MKQRFEELILPCIDAAYNLARYLTRDPIAADDIVQDALLRAFRAFADYRGGDPKSWLLAIVRNCCYSWLDRTRAEVGRTADVPVESIDGAAYDSPHEIIARQSEVDAVRARVERLPEPFRETLVLRELEELSYKQIAQITGVPIGTVMSRLARARQLLLDEMGDVT